MELLTEQTTLKGVLVIIIFALIYALKVTRGDLKRSVDEGYKNMEFFKTYFIKSRNEKS